MTKKLLSITVKGKAKTFSFNFYGDTKYLKEWRDEGLEIDEIENIIPIWVVNTGLTRTQSHVLISKGLELVYTKFKRIEITIFSNMMLACIFKCYLCNIYLSSHLFILKT